jgi:hypothetical protein
LSGPTRAAGALAALAALAACASLGGARPRLVPLPGALHRLAALSPDAAVTLVAQELAARGVPLVTVSATEGYVESAWFSAATRGRAAEPFGADTGTVRIRVFADPTAGRTRLFAEVAMRFAWDPSLPERELERMVPEGHGALALLREVLDLLPGVDERAQP